MQTSNQLNKDLFYTLGENIKHAFLIFDREGNILSLNSQAKKIFPLSDINQNIFNILDIQSAKVLRSLFAQLFEGKGLLTEEIRFIIKSGEELRLKLNLNTYQEENEVFVFCSAIPQENKISLNGITNLKVQHGDLIDIVNNKEILKIINDIKSLFPFTFIGKEKILNEVDKLDEFFWIEDINGNFTLVNKNLAANIGLKRTQIEGKPTKTFIPSYLLDFYQSIKTYIKGSENCVVMEGLPLTGISTVQKMQTLEIPLSDAEGKVIAIIGISQNISENKKSYIVPDNISQYNLNFLRDFPKAVALIEDSGKFMQGSKEFCKLFVIDLTDLEKLNFFDIITDEITWKIQQFLSSSAEKTIIELNDGLRINDDETDAVNIYLSKFNDEDKQHNGFLILTDKKEKLDSLEFILNSRGKMFEILIQNNPEPIFIYDTENLRFLEVNDSALELYGYRKDEFLQMDLTDLYTAEDIQTLLDSSNKENKHGKFSGPYKHKRKDGSSVYVELSKINFKFNKRDAHFNIVRDVTGNLELEKTSQLFKSAFDNTNDLLFVTDNTGFITFVNKHAIDQLEISKSELEGTSFTSLVKDEERGTINSTIFQSHMKEAVTLTTELKQVNGEFMEIEITATPILNYKKDVDSFTIIGKIEAKPEVEEKIKEVIKEVVVEKPIPQNNVYRSEKIEVSFLSNLFHEILTPINVILGFVQELTDGVENVSPEQKEAAGIIKQNRERLLSLMNSVIDYSNLQQNNVEMNIEDEAITEIIDKIQNNLIEITDSDSIEFAYGKISSSLKFKTDKQKFENLVFQLVKITSRLTREKKIYFSSYQYDSDSFIINIRDNYNESSNYLSNNLFNLFRKTNNEEIKNLGISKLSLQLAKSLLSVLKGKFDIIKGDKDKIDYGFIFPMDYTSAAKVEVSPGNDESLKETEAEKTLEGQKEIETPDLKNYEKLDETIETEKTEELVQSDTGTTDEEQITSTPDLKNYEKLDESVETEKTEEPVQSDTGTTDEEQITSTPDLKNYEKLDESVETEKTEEPAQSDTGTTDEEQITSTPEQEFSDVNLKKEEVTNEPIISSSSSQKIISPNKLDLSALSCLYIEDQVDSQILFKVQMKGLKDIKFAVSFEEALPLLDTENFDFIVIDINLQGEYNGLDALKIIHKMAGYEHIPIIAVTAYVLPGDKEKFIATGFNDFISKPIFREKMVDSLENMFLS